ncbi:MAG: sugar transferase [Bacteroidia bacterium]|nr:sugar transferase [Bacteroidia bacterium]
MIYRVRDILLATFLLILISPLFILIILALFISQRKVFFIQQRPGLNEKAFFLVKFSTLYDAAPGVDEAYRQQDRLTPVGKVLRRFSLDELPQLLNVILGDMSLVGPRPLLMEYLSLYTEEEHQRHKVMPGITGWAQINGRNKIPFKRRFQYDLWYVKHKSFLLDAKIIFLTVYKVFKKEGVYADGFTTSPRFDGTN